LQGPELLGLERDIDKVTWEQIEQGLKHAVQGMIACVEALKYRALPQFAVQDQLIITVTEPEVSRGYEASC
jgi:hypothetical protein